jgi:molybdate transport system regulatory protein
MAERRPPSKAGAVRAKSGAAAATRVLVTAATARPPSTITDAARRRPRERRLGVQGALWLGFGEQTLGGAERMQLLRAVADTGSITRAAQAVGLSYKSAWDDIDAMNTLAGEPLVLRSAGGRGGGATRLTARGQRLVERFEQIDAVHQRFVQMLDRHSLDLGAEFSLLEALNMKTSARNQFAGTVTAVRTGAVNDEVELKLPGGARIVAMVTGSSTLALGLRTGMTAIALVKASSVIVATELHDVKLSARNQLAGIVGAMNPGAVNAEVVIELDGGGRIVAIVAQAGVQPLGLAVGARATALFDASSVILAVTV